MKEQLKVDIVRSLLDLNVDKNRSIVLAPSLNISTDKLFLQFINSSFNCTVQKCMAIIVSTGILNSPDSVSAFAMKSEDNLFEMKLHIRTFKGSLAANDQYISLVRMELGELMPGKYQFNLHKTVSYFTDLRHSENIADAVITQQQASFECN